MSQLEEHTTEEVTLRRIDSSMAVDDPDEMNVHGWQVVDTTEVECPHEKWMFHTKREDDRLLGVTVSCTNCDKKIVVDISVDELYKIKEIHEGGYGIAPGEKL
jgi:hypothetical protein